MKCIQQDNISLSLLLKDMITSNQMIHKQMGEMCKQLQPYPNAQTDDISTQLLNEIVKSNQAIQTQIVELSNKQPVVQQITNNIVQNTQNNNSFSIQVFLDETCADAMNLSAFLKTLEITNEDLVRNTEIGFVKGMSAIIKREMCDKLPVNKRPVHCTDIKRETVYYKENDKWHKEEGRVVEEDMMFQLSRDCLRRFTEWRRVNPDTHDMNSQFNLLCDKIPAAVVGGFERATRYPKTMTEIYKHCLIDKKNMK
jgi:hypothetical protein